MRDLLPTLKVPCLNFIGGATKCHVIAGIAHIGDSIPKGRNVQIDGAGKSPRLGGIGACTHTTFSHACPRSPFLLACSR